MGFEEPIRWSISSGVTRLNWERRHWGGGVRRSREISGSGGGWGDACISDGAEKEWLMALILSAKNWRNELQVAEVEVGRLSAQGLKSLLTVEKRVLGLQEGSVKMLER